MADNLELNVGSGGATLAADEIAGVLHQRVKMQHGADGSATDVAGASPLPIDWAGTAPPIGAGTEAAALRVTLATDSTGVLTVDNAGTFAVQVDAALPTGANTIGEITIGVATTAAGDLAKAIDAVAGGADVGVAALAVRDDSLTTLTPIDGDWVPLRVSSTGALHVTGGGGGTEYTEDVATANPIVGTATLIERDDALSAVTPIEGDWIGLRGSAEGALWTQDFNSDAILADTATLAGAVSGSEMQVDVLTVPAPLSTTGGGTEAAALRVTLANDSTGVLSIDDNGGALTVDNGGTFVTQIDGAALTALQLIDNIVHVADAVAGSTDSGVGLLGVRDDEKAAIGADSDYVQLRTDRFAALKVTQLPDATSEVKYAIIDAATSGNNTLVAAAGAGIKIRLLAAFLIAAGTVTARFESAADGTAMSGQMNLVVNSGFTLPFCPVGWADTADNALLNLELSGAVSVDGMLVYVEV